MYVRLTSLLCDGVCTLQIHLLQYSTTVSEAELARFSRTRFFHSEPIATWIEAITETERMRVVMWHAYWLLFVALYLLSLAHYLHSTGQPTPVELSLALVALGLYELLGQVFIGWKNSDVHDMLWCMLTRKGIPVAWTAMYRFFQAMFGTCVLSLELGHLFGYTCAVNKVLYAVGYITCTWWAFMSLFVFLLQSERFGHLVIMLEKMLIEAFLFMVITSTYFLMFPFVFSVLHTSPSCLGQNTESTTNSTSDGGEDGGSPDDDGTYTDRAFATYDTILLALGITVPDPLYFNNAQLPIVSVGIYMLLLFWIGITMLNQLIAVMTDRVGEINQHKAAIKQIQRVSAGLLLKDNSKLGGRFVKTLLNLGCCRRRKDHHYSPSDRRDRVFLHVIEVPALCEDTMDW